MRHPWLLLVLALALGAGRTVRAQVRPDVEWRTIEAAPIRVHFTPALEPLARRTLANALAAYARLAAELPAPRGMIDVVVTDHVDYANGSATPFPTNRIIIHARPPVDEPALRNHEDWNLTLVTHEMAHIFHLDRARGIWGLGQRVFGRAAPLFPNAYAPRWLLEGIAVHYETRFTRGGRLAGTEFPAAVRALALDGALPPLDALVLPYPRHPGANVPYLLGASLVDRTVRRDPAVGPDVAMARLIDRMSGRLNPWRHDASAREAVGESFHAIYAEWRDSVTRAARAEARGSGDSASVRVRTAHGWQAAFPRFGPDGELLYVGDDAVQNPGLYEIEGAEGRVRRARRNSVDPNVPIGGGRTVHAELDRTDPYSVRSDLYVGRGERRTALSRDGRLAHPDAHVASGRIVAVQTLPGGTALVLLSARERAPRVLAAGSLDRTWTSPRWSRDGTHIAAALWERGGRTAVVVMDTLGREVRRFAPRATDLVTRLALVDAPAWLPGDTLLLFVSDHEGRPTVYRGDVRTGAYDRLWETRTALRWPDASADGTQLAASELHADGWRIVTRAMPALPALPPAAPARDADALPFLAPAAVHDSGAVRAYRAWRHVLPRWWLPSTAVSDEGTGLVGAMTGGRDLVGRHSWQAAVLQDLVRPEQTVSAAYAYAGLGNPVISFAWQQRWDHFTLLDASDQPIGVFADRGTLLALSAYLSRPRLRSSTYLIGAAEFEQFVGRVYPAGLASAYDLGDLLDPYTVLRLIGAVGFSTMQRPGLSVSVEDGVAGQLTLRHRLSEGLGFTNVGDAIVQASAAKSLPLPGYARHVLAGRVAVGVSDAKAREPFEIGGVSGGTLEVLPGFAWGDPQRTFFVRGFAPAALEGDRALAGSIEYRAPLRRVARGVGLAPVFLQKLSVLAFSDVGSAWCTAEPSGSAPCPDADARTWLSSVGGELVLDAALQYDVLYRFRVGVAKPLRALAGEPRAVSFYVTLGSTF
jgi:hypothetical protein